MDISNNNQGLYDLPNSWTWVKLENCVQILDNKRIPINASDREKRIEGKLINELYPYYGATGEVGFIDDYLFDEELVLLGEDGAPFLEFTKKKAYLIKGKTWVNNHAHVLKAFPEITINKYIENYLNIFDYHQYVTGTTRLKLNQSRMKDIPVPIPPLNEQKRIVEKIEELFTKLDAGIELLKKLQIKLKRYRQSVLKSAVEGKLTEKWRQANQANLEPAEILLKRILQERREKWEAEQVGKKTAKYQEPIQPDISDLPDLPEGWCWVTIDTLLLSIQNGLYLPRTLYGLGTPILRIDDFQNDFSSSSSEFNLVNAEKTDIEKYSLNTNDLIINRVNSLSHLGKCLVITEKHLPAIFESNMMRIKLSNLSQVFFVSFYLRSIIGKKYLISNAKWAVNQASINQVDVSQTPVPLPPLQEQNKILEEIDRIFSVTDQLEKIIERNIKRAEKLRQSILKQAFTGKLVPQDINDEPAAKLLEKIKQEKAKSQPKKKTTKRSKGNS